jgi:hypothetical protein
VDFCNNDIRKRDISIREKLGIIYYFKNTMKLCKLYTLSSLPEHRNIDISINSIIQKLGKDAVDSHKLQLFGNLLFIS